MNWQDCGLRRVCHLIQSVRDGIYCEPEDVCVCVCVCVKEEEREQIVDQEDITLVTYSK